MNLLPLLYLAYSALVEYRFGRDYGSNFYDYSGNSNHGTLAKAPVTSTDRGIYLGSDDCHVDVKKIISNLPWKFSFLGWAMLTNSETRLFFRTSGPSTKFHIGRKLANRSLNIYVQEGGKTLEKDGGTDSFPDSIWFLITLYYDESAFYAYRNADLLAILNYKFASMNGTLYTGVGAYSKTPPSARGFVWNFIILTELPTFSNYIGGASTTCLIGAGSCSSCTQSIKDPNLGSGCLSNNIIPTQNSFGINCLSKTIGCSKTVQLSCASTTNVCYYDYLKNQCYSYDLTTKATTVLSCLCESSFIKISNQCCNSDCATCTALGSCITCLSANTVSISGTCSCIPGYFAYLGVCCLLGSQCSACSSSSPCTACSDPNAQISLNSCVCKPGFYLSSTNTCKPCGSGCSSCSSTNLCISCISGNTYISSDSCWCSPGFYLPSGLNTCSACGSRCKTCESISICSVCFDYNSVISSGSCICPDGFYLNQVTNFCDKCGPGCKICQDSNTCTTCFDLTLTIVGGSCTCSGSFYLALGNTCGTCGTTCKTCLTTASCQTCTEVSSVITCDCNIGFYDDGNNQCISCENGCKRCSSIKCLECFDNSFDIAGLSCVCKSGFYKVDSKTCASCGSRCKTCSQSIPCSDCFDINSYSTGISCICLDGFYLDTDNFCKSCMSGCKVCDNTLACSKCFDSNAVIIGQICDCGLGYYYDQSNKKCIKCGISCKSCNQANPCIDCLDLKTFISNNECFCNSGYFKENESTCSQCGRGCSFCSSLHDCSLCVSGNTLIYQGECFCLEGFYELTPNNCQPCNKGCQTCDSSNCLLCYDKVAFVSGKDCICPSFHFISSISPYSCLECPKGCLFCTSESACDKCAYKHSYFNASYQNCSCIPGYFFDEDMNECFECPFACSSCDNLTCFECFDLKAVNINTSCICTEGFYMDRLSFMCKACHSTCKSCDESKCLECYSNNTQISGPACSCKTGFWSNDSLLSIDSCKPCHKECLSCKQQDLCENCISFNSTPRNDSGCRCNQGFFNTTPLLQESSCQLCHEIDCLACRNGVNSSGKCIECPSLCTRCDNNSNCQECAENSHIVKKKCICNESYDFSNEKCIKRYFHANITVNSKHMILLRFSEPANLSLADFELVIDGVLFEKNITRRNNSAFLVMPKFNSSLNGILLTQVLITRNNFKSNNNSFLFEKNMTAFMNFSSTIENDRFLKPSVQVMIFSSIAFGVFSNPSSFWALLNTIQLIYYMPLNSIPYTSRLRKTTASLIDYSIVPNVFSLVSDSKATSRPSENAERFGISSTVILLNSGPIWISFLTSLLSNFLIYLLARYYTSSEKIQKLHKKLKYNLIIRFWIESYLDIGLFGFIQTTAVRNMQDILSEYEGYFYYCGGLVLCFLVIVSPFFILVTMINSNSHRADPEFLVIFSSLYQEFKNSQGLVCTLYYPGFLIRRLAYVLTQIFLNEYPGIQAYLNIGFTLFMIVFLVYFRPFQERENFFTNFLSEICVFVVFLSTSFLLYTKEKYYLEIIEDFCIYVLIGTIGLQTLIGGYCFIRNLKNIWQKFKQIRSRQFLSAAQNLKY